jgi:hypothetical protein
VNEREYVAMSLEVLAKVLRDMPAPPPVPDLSAPTSTAVAAWLNTIAGYPDRWLSSEVAKEGTAMLPTSFCDGLAQLVQEAGQRLGVWD